MKCSLNVTLVIVSVALLSCVPITTPIVENDAATSNSVFFEQVYTGLHEVDSIINAIVEQDVDAIVDHVQFVQMPCTHRAGLGGPPKCGEGQPEGAVVEVFPIMGTSGFFLTPDTIHSLKPNVSEPYAVYKVPEDTKPIDNWPIGEYGLVFPNQEPVPRVITVFLNNGKIVRINNDFVESPSQALPEIAQILYMSEEAQTR